jgi:hypothetical protein
LLASPSLALLPHPVPPQAATQPRSSAKGWRANPLSNDMAQHHSNQRASAGARLAADLPWKLPLFRKILRLFPKGRGADRATPWRPDHVGGADPTLMTQLDLELGHLVGQTAPEPPALRASQHARPTATCLQLLLLARTELRVAGSHHTVALAIRIVVAASANTSRLDAVEACGTVRRARARDSFAMVGCAANSALATAGLIASLHADEAAALGISRANRPIHARDTVGVRRASP